MSPRPPQTLLPGGTRAPTATIFALEKLVVSSMAEPNYQAIKVGAGPGSTIRAEIRRRWSGLSIETRNWLRKV